MDDVHFLERLERVSAAQTDRALDLYRDPEFIRYLFTVVDPPACYTTMAIAIDARPEPPWVLVDRSGKFLTCLASGMLPSGCWRLDKPRLDKLAERHERLRAGHHYMKALLDEPRTLDRLWSQLGSGGQRVPREAMVALLPAANFIARDVLHRFLKVHGVVLDTVRERAHRLLQREGRLNAREQDLLEALWSDLWCATHLMTLLGAVEHDTLVKLGSHEGALRGLLTLGMGFGFWPLVLRTAWLAARIPARVVVADLAKMAREDRSNDWRGPSSVMALAFIGVSQRSVAREEVRATLTPLTQRPTDETAPPLERSVTRWAATLLPAVGAPSDDKATAPAALACWRPGASADHRAERVRWSNHAGHAWNDELYLTTLPGIIGWAARAAPENFYAGADQRDELLPPFKPELCMRWLRSARGMMAATPMPVQRDEPRVGRNEPCRCGSGKKHKKCCGSGRGETSAHHD